MRRAAPRPTRSPLRLAVPATAGVDAPAVPDGTEPPEPPAAPDGADTRVDVCGDARTDTRAIRAPGVRMRSHLLDAAVGLFKAQGLSGTSVAQIAQAAGAFPSQVTYYFRTKEALFVEAACREVLYAAQQTEQAAASARTPEAYLGSLVAAAVQAEALPLYIEALALARRRQDLSPLIARTTERLHAEGERAYAAKRAASGWALRDDPGQRARRFWALVLGVVLRDAAAGATPAQSAAEIQALLRSEWMA